MIDLHVHSTCSDGSETPARVVELAVAAGCEAVALTDHDSVAGLAEARTRAQDLGIGFLPGCEVSCVFSPGTMHMLSYFIEGDEGPLQAELERLRDDRVHRNERLVQRLVELGLPISFEQVQAAAGGSIIGRPHFASVLVSNGAATNIQDAFDRILAKGMPGYIPKARIDAATCIEACRGTGALAVLAHPLSLGLETPELDRLVRELAKTGLCGMECYYGRYSPEQRCELADMARRHGLVVTGGSDFHGRFKPDLAIGIGTGDLDVPDAAVGELLACKADPGAFRP